MAGLSDRYYRMGLCWTSFYLNHKHFPVWCPILFLRRNHQQQKKHQLYILWENRIIETLWRCYLPPKLILRTHQLCLRWCVSLATWRKEAEFFCFSRSLIVERTRVKAVGVNLNFTYCWPNIIFWEASFSGFSLWKIFPRNSTFLFSHNMQISQNTVFL